VRASLCAHCTSEVKWIEISSGLKPVQPELYPTTVESMISDYKSRCESEKTKWDASVQLLREFVDAANNAINSAYATCPPKLLALHMAISEKALKDAPNGKLRRPVAPIAQSIVFGCIALVFSSLLGTVGFWVSTLVTVGVIALIIYGELKTYQRNQHSLRVVDSVMAPLEEQLTSQLLTMSALTRTLAEIQLLRRDYLTLCTLAESLGLKHSPSRFAKATATIEPTRVYRNHVESFSCRKGIDRWAKVVGQLDSYLKSVE
jgi:hypothetical protein